MFVTFIVFGILTVIAAVLALTLKIKDDSYNAKEAYTRIPNKIAWGVTAFFGFLTILFLFLGSFYVQDAGTAVVEKDKTGNIVGQSNTTGWHWKSIFVDTVEFNVRTQPVSFMNPENGSSGAGYEADGPQITTTDKDQVASDIDINVRYTLRPSAVTDIYVEYRDEESFKNALIYPVIREVVRTAPNKFSTEELLSNRAAVGAAIRDALEKAWEDTGVSVDDVSLQAIRPPAAVMESYAEAQKAEISIAKAESNLRAAEVKAQEKVVTAKAESEANSLLTASLTPEILQQRYLDTLKELAVAGNVVVVPEGFNGLVNVGK